MVGLEGAGEYGGERPPPLDALLVWNSRLKHAAFPYVKPSFPNIGASASLSAKSAINSGELISSSVKERQKKIRVSSRLYNLNITEMVPISLTTNGEHKLTSYAKKLYLYK